MEVGVVILVLAYSASKDVTKCCPQHFSLGEDLKCHKSGVVWEFQGGTITVSSKSNACILSTLQQESKVHCVDNVIGRAGVFALKCAQNKIEFPKTAYVRKYCPFGETLVRRNECKPDPGKTWQDLGDIVFVHVDPEFCGKTSREILITSNISSLPSDTLCIDHYESTYIVQTNSNTVCSSFTCVRKCCPFGETYGEDDQCTSTSSLDSLSLHGASNLFSNFAFYHDKCLDPILLAPDQYPDDEYQVLDSGILFYPTTKTSEDSFCLDFHDLHNRTRVFACAKEEDEEILYLQMWRPFFLLVSCCFLIFTLFIYASLPSFRNLHGKTVMCYCASLFLAFFFLATTFLLVELSYLWSSVCEGLGIAILVSFLASFTWLNTLSFDIWWTFGSTRAPLGRKSRNRRKFYLYSSYAWGLPLCVTAAAIVLDHSDLLSPSLRPGIGQRYCWFDTESSGRWIFFYGPVSVLLLCNCVFFLLTVRAYSKIKDNLSHFSNPNCRKNRLNADTEKLIMTLKLFLVMGVSWIMDIISAAYPDYESFGLFSDILHSLEGVGIFVIFGWKKKTMRALKDRFSTSQRSTTANVNTTTFSSSESSKMSLSILKGSS